MVFFYEYYFSYVKVVCVGARYYLKQHIFTRRDVEFVDLSRGRL